MIASKILAPSAVLILGVLSACSAKDESGSDVAVPDTAQTLVVYPQRDTTTPLPAPGTPGATPDGGGPNPTLPYFASVTANGTGCPAGSWDVQISPDGQTFTLRFSAYETSVDPGAVIAVKDCALGIDLHSPGGLSWTIASAFYQGYGFLDSAGMTATQTAKYYFQGNPLQAREGRTDLKGPFDDEYVFVDQVNITDLVWSPCGTDRRVNVNTRIVVKNNTKKTGTGYLNTAVADGSLELVFRLQFKACTQ